MLEKITGFENHEMIVVSKRTVLTLIGMVLGLTLLLMVFFLTTDFDYILGRKTLAMKVGQTQISLSELKLIQNASGVRARQMPENAFAVELLETVLLAEAGRRNGLDRKPDFMRKIGSFDAAMKAGQNDENIAKAAFLLEELADAARADVVDNHNYDFELAAMVKPVSPIPAKLHLRTILAENSDQGQLILTQRLSGIEFSDLNASWSRSLYKSVGGDIGWKSVSDFPEEVFAGLLKLEPGVLAEAFTDETGTHLFEVVSRPTHNPVIAEKAAREKALRDLKRRRLQQYLAELVNQIDYWINPVLQNRSQVVSPISEPENKSSN